MYSRVNYMVVGIFVLLFGTGLLWFAFWLGKYGLNEEHYLYRLEMNDSVAGLSQDADVMLRGVDIGRVSQIRINPKNIEQTEIYLQIAQSVPIKEDMVASTKMFGVTGLLSIELEGGTNSAKTLQPTAKYIPTIRSKASLVTILTNNVESLSIKLDKVMAQSEKLLSESNLQSVEKIFNNVEDLTHNSKELNAKALIALEELELTLKTFRVSIEKMSGDFEGATVDFAQIKEKMIPTINDFKRVTLKVEQSLDRGDYNLKKMFKPLIVEMQILSGQMSDIAKTVEQSPSDLLFKSRKPLKGPGE